MKTQTTNKQTIHELKKYLSQVNKLMKQYYVYIEDLSRQRYFEYDALYQIDVQARQFLVSFQTFCQDHQFRLDNLWKSNLKLFAKIESLINDIYENFLKTIFYDLQSVALNSDNFEGYYYFLNVYKMHILIPYLIASCLVDDKNHVNTDHLAWVCANNIRIFEKYDLVCDYAKIHDDESQKQLMFSKFSYQSFFSVLDNLSNLALYVTMELKQAKSLILKSRFDDWKVICLFSLLGVVIITLTLFLILK